jgi:hypothetical protein
LLTNYQSSVNIFLDGERASTCDGRDVRAFGRDHRHAAELRSRHSGREFGSAERTAGKMGKHKKTQCHCHPTGLLITFEVLSFSQNILIVSLFHDREY